MNQKFKITKELLSLSLTHTHTHTHIHPNLDLETHLDMHNLTCQDEHLNDQSLTGTESDLERSTANVAWQLNDRKKRPNPLYCR